VLAPTVDAGALQVPSGASPSGDPEAARRLLVAAGISLPVTVRIVHASSEVSDTAYAALAAGWQRAGFDVRLTGVEPERYYETVTDPAAAQRFDVFRGVASSDIPSPGGVLPALFDSRTNIDSRGPGQDLGYVDDPAVNRLIDAAQGTSDPSARERAWVAVDDAIRDGDGYVALAATKAVHLHGAGVLHYEEHAVAGAVDLATVAVR
jgi:peptide/nickel transport system substrate-binding protein